MLPNYADQSADLPDRVSSRSVWAYEGVGGKLVRRLKFDQVKAAALPLTEGMAETVRSMGLPDDTVVTWVTMPDSRRRERVIDHAQILAEGMADLAGLPCRQLIRRVENDEPLRHQLGLNAAERRHNLQGTFICGERLSGTVLLIDDVYTTGATTETCAAALLAAGADWVVILTAVRALLNH